MVCTSENMGEHVQMAWNVRLQRRLAALHIIWLWFVSFYFRLNFLLSHAVDEVSVSEVPADRLWFLCFQNLLHHFRPATMLLRDYHLVYVQNYNVLESEIYISTWWITFLPIFVGPIGYRPNRGFHHHHHHLHHPALSRLSINSSIQVISASPPT